MGKNLQKRLLLITAALIGTWLGLRYFLPVLLPFLMGTALALAAEPLVRSGQRYLHMPRAVAAGLGVSITLVMVLGLVSFLGAAAVRQLGKLASDMPDLEGAAGQGMGVLRDWLLGIAEKTPEGLRPVLIRSVGNLLNDSTELMEQLTGRIPMVVTSALGRVPNGLLGIGTGVISAFMISARLPWLKTLQSKEPLQHLGQKYLPALKRVRDSLWAWFRAQLKLMAVCYAILAAGFLLLGIRRGFFLAALVALVDAVPMLGTGVILVPWALVNLLQQRQFMAIGLLCVYAAVLIVRTVLEPRLIGKNLGIDPLLTLVSLYVGYRFWGLAGMLLAPVLVSAVKTALFPTAGIQKNKNL